MRNVPGISLAAIVFVAATFSSAAAMDGLGGIGVDGRGNIVVVRSNPDRVLVFAAGSDGDVAPARTIEGYRTDLRGPAAVAVVKSGKTYVLNANSCESITVYAPGAHGDALPVAEIEGDKTGLCGGKSVGRIAVSAGGTVYVSKPDADQVLVFAAGADGNAAPIGPAVRLFPGAGGDAAPLAVIDGTASGLGASANGDVLVLPMTSRNSDTSNRPEVNIWRLAGDAYSMLDQITGADTELSDPIGISEGSNGAIYVLDDRCNGAALPPVFDAAVVVFAPNSNGDAKPSAVIDGTQTGLGCP